MKVTMFSATGLMCAGLCLLSSAEAADAVSVSACLCGRGEIILAPMVTMKSAQSATLQFGAFDLTLCTTTMQDGTTVIASTLTSDTDAGARVKFTPPVAIVSAGKSATVCAGDWDVRFTATIDK